MMSVLPTSFSTAPPSHLFIASPKALLASMQNTEYTQPLVFPVLPTLRSFCRMVCGLGREQSNHPTGRVSPMTVARHAYAASMSGQRVVVHGLPHKLDA
ncbi:MAG: hypothetical protein QOC85_3988 [Streptomyces sp.]|nr:hypothetical protein [Streptomyces sp.]